jgi:hypothetical protein
LQHGVGQQRFLSLHRLLDERFNQVAIGEHRVVDVKGVTVALGGCA